MQMTRMRFLHNNCRRMRVRVRMRFWFFDVVLAVRVTAMAVRTCRIIVRAAVVCFVVFFRHPTNHADRQFAHCLVSALECMGTLFSHKLSHAHNVLIASIRFNMHLDSRDENSLCFRLSDGNGPPANRGREVCRLIRSRMRCELPDMWLRHVDDQRIVFDLFTTCQQTKETIVNLLTSCNPRLSISILFACEGGAVCSKTLPVASAAGYAT